MDVIGKYLELSIAPLGLAEGRGYSDAPIWTL